jgi:hypothetical protein
MYYLPAYSWPDLPFVGDLRHYDVITPAAVIRRQHHLKSLSSVEMSWSESARLKTDLMSVIWGDCNLVVSSCL